MYPYSNLEKASMYVCLYVVKARKSGSLEEKKAMEGGERTRTWLFIIIIPARNRECMHKM